MSRDGIVLSRTRPPPRKNRENIAKANHSVAVNVFNSAHARPSGEDLEKITEPHVAALVDIAKTRWFHS